MGNVKFEELKHISAKIKAIVKRSEQEARKTNKEEQNLLDQLAADREELLSNMIYHGYGSKH